MQLSDNYATKVEHFKTYYRHEQYFESNTFNEYF